MSSVLSEYPESLPAPMVGVVVPTERRKISSLHGVQNFRTVQRDRHGTRTYAFTYTREQAAIFREWWAEWEQLGGGWFAANWPLPWSRGPNVFRFKGPPAWSMIPGGNKGQGYWRVSGTVEIRGRGMLPTVEVLYLTSTPYPIVSVDSMESFLDFSAKEGLSIITESVSVGVYSGYSARSIFVDLFIKESIDVKVNFDAGASQPFDGRLILPPESLQEHIDSAFTARRAFIRYNTPAESLQLTIGANYNAS